MSSKIRQALINLGIKHGKVRVKVEGGHGMVWLNGEFFGIFDESRMTFVD